MTLARWTVALAMGVMAACGGAGMNDERALKVLDGVPEEAWSRLASEKIYFGHQSVGYDIVGGIEDIARLDPRVRLKVVETKDLASFDGPVFAHSKNGENKKPSVKIESFEQAMDTGLGDRVDLAFFKFCYVDFAADTDVHAVFAEYKAAMARLRERFPRTQWVHVTVPLTVVESGPKALAKRVLRRPLAGVAENEVRSRFNALLRAEYSGREPLFDLAAVESTFPDGKTASFEASGTRCPRLIASYSYDGRHLNEQGRRWVAAHLLRFLAELPATPASMAVGST